MSKVNSRDRLAPLSWNRALGRHWRGQDLLVGVGFSVSRAVGWTGVVLPYVRVDGRPVVPVVEVDPDAVEQRLRREEGPILERARLRDLAEQRFATAPPPAVVLTGYVMVEPFAVARHHLAALRTWAPTVLAVPAWAPLSVLAAAECDYFGYRVCVSDGRRAWETEMGATMCSVGTGDVDAWQRLRDEQMFDLALAVGLFDGASAACLSISS